MNRRTFMKTTAAATTGLLSFPAFVPSVAFGRAKPNDKIQIGQIGIGRIAREHDLPEIIKHDLCRVVAVADLDSKRGADGKKWIESQYAKRTGKADYVDVKVYTDYREMLKDPGIDAVIISTPDHWHAQPAMEAALAGKDIYLQKPTSLTIAEGRALSDMVHRTGRIFQIGCQQRSLNPWPQFHRACELVRNGRIGDIKNIKIGLPVDPSGLAEPKMPVPANLNYDMWLGSTPLVYYTEKRVHPQNDYSRPGWLRCEQFGAGMITGWGSHHLDIAHWGMGTEYSGPVEIEGKAEFPKSGLWDVHGKFKVLAKYANGVTMEVRDDLPNGVRFEGTEGWIFVTRGSAVTSSDPGAGNPGSKSLDAGDPKILDSQIGPNETHLYESPEQHLNWLQCIRSRNQPIGPVEVGHRSCSACLISHIAMKLGRKLQWDPKKERFVNDEEANKLLSRPQRRPYGTQYVES
jgi:myo-inositol 2-dehydrogenase / D-chiro-inositol 1-dehydrogenase